jgi:hypothetical protein
LLLVALETHLVWAHPSLALQSVLPIEEDSMTRQLVEAFPIHPLLASSTKGQARMMET